MKVVLIIIAFIVYLSIGGCMAAIEEAERYERTGEYGFVFIDLILFLFWPFCILADSIITGIKKLKEKFYGKRM